MRAALPPFPVSLVPRAELRVYLPLASFPERVRERWAGVLASSPRPTVPAPRLRRVESLAREAASRDPELAVIVQAEQVFVCPRREARSSLVALLESRHRMSLLEREAILPSDLADRLAARLHATSRPQGRAFGFVRAAPWHVPVEWFLAVTESERQYAVDGEGHAQVRFVTPLPHARRRVSRAVDVTREAGLDDVRTDALADLHSWVSAFRGNGLLELDYGGVARLFTGEELADDVSARHAQESLDALSRGDVVRAALRYAAVIDHWARVRTIGERS